MLTMEAPVLTEIRGFWKRLLFSTWSLFSKWNIACIKKVGAQPHPLCCCLHSKTEPWWQIPAPIPGKVKKRLYEMKKGGSKEKYKQLTGDSMSVFVSLSVCECVEIKNDNGSDEMIGQKMGTWLRHLRLCSVAVMQLIVFPLVLVCVCVW